jgi:hypothetical protein
MNEDGQINAHESAFGSRGCDAVLLWSDQSWPQLPGCRRDRANSGRAAGVVTGLVLPWEMRFTPASSFSELLG